MSNQHYIIPPIAPPEGSAKPQAIDLGGPQALVVGQQHQLRVLQRQAARRHVFGDPVSLARWTAKHLEAWRAEILVGEEVVHAMDGGRDADGDHVQATLQMHPRLKRWVDLAVRSQARAINHHTLHQHVVTCTADFSAMTDDRGGVIDTGAHLLQSLGRLTVSKASSFNSTIAPNGAVEVAGSDASATISAKILPEYYLRVPFFVGVIVDGVEPTYLVRLRVQLDISSGMPAFTLTLPDLDVVTLDARAGVGACIQQVLDDHEDGDGEWLVVLGEAERVTWLTDGWPPSGSPKGHPGWTPPARSVDAAPSWGGPCEIEPYPPEMSAGEAAPTEP